MSLKQRARLGARSARPCSCGADEATEGEHGFGCPKRPRRGAAAKKPRARIPPRRETARRTSRVVDLEFVDLVHRMPCQARRLPGHRCSGPIQAHHAGAYTSGPNPHGKGQKPDDTTCIALCEGAHADIEDRLGKSGTFGHMTGEDAREWQDARIVEARAFVAALRAGVRPADAFRW